MGCFLVLRHARLRQKVPTNMTPTPLIWQGITWNVALFREGARRSSVTQSSRTILRIAFASRSSIGEKNRTEPSANNTLALLLNRPPSGGSLSWSLGRTKSASLVQMTASFASIARIVLARPFLTLANGLEEAWQRHLADNLTTILDCYHAAEHIDAFAAVCAAVMSRHASSGRTRRRGHNHTAPLLDLLKEKIHTQCGSINSARVGCLISAGACSTVNILETHSVLR